MLSSSLPVLRLGQEFEYHQAEVAGDDKDNDRDGAGHAVVFAGAQIVVQVHNQSCGGAVYECRYLCQRKFTCLRVYVY